MGEAPTEIPARTTGVVPPTATTQPKPPRGILGYLDLIIRGGALVALVVSAPFVLFVFAMGAGNMRSGSDTLFVVFLFLLLLVAAGVIVISSVAPQLFLRRFSRLRTLGPILGRAPAYVFLVLSLGIFGSWFL
jgi:hypothetical protein